MSELVEAVQKAVRREVAQVLRQAADTIDGSENADYARKTVTAADLGRQFVRSGDSLTFRHPTGRKRGRPTGAGFRHQQVLDLLKKHPEGLSGKQINDCCEMTGTQVYGVLKRLQRDGEVKKRGKVYVASG